METVSKKNETETEEVRILREETKKALKTLYSIGTDAEEFKALPLSECTRAAIYARRKVSDALESLFVLHRILYCVDDEASANKILDAARGMENIANEYIIASIEDKMGGNWKGDMIMETEELIIDTKNLYVQGLIKVINDFMLEEASDCFSPEDRLKDKIKMLKKVFPEERKRMVIAGQTPIFGNPDSGLYKLIFKN